MIFHLQQLLNLFNCADSRVRRIVLVAGASYLGRFSQGAAVLITLPIARRSFSPDLFGVWMMLSSFLSFMSFADFGVGNGVLNQITKAHATEDRDLLRRTLASGYVITFGVGAVLLFVWLLWKSLSLEPTSLAGVIEVADRTEVLRALSAFAFVLAVNIPASLILRVQLGVQQGYLNGLNQLFSALLTMISVPLCFHLGGSVAELVMATIGVQVLVNTLNTVLWLYCYKVFRNFDWSYSLDIATVRLLLLKGSMFFVLQLAAALSFQSDAIVITQTLGQSAYGSFAVVQKIFLFASMIINVSMVGLWPAFGNAVACQNMEWARKALVRSALAVTVITVALVSPLAISVPWLVEHWVAGSAKPAYSLITVLAVWTIIEAVGGVFAAFLNAANILRPQLLLAICMALTAFGLKWMLTPVLGAAGAVLATILAYCIIAVPGQILIFKAELNLKA